MVGRRSHESITLNSTDRAGYDLNKDGKLDETEKAAMKADEDAAKAAKKAEKDAKQAAKEEKK